MFGNLGMGELAVILVIVLVLFGAKRVPEISASFGKGIREFKRNLGDVEGAVASQLVTPDQRPFDSPVAPPRSAMTPRDGSEDVAREPKRLL